MQKSSESLLSQSQIQKYRIFSLKPQETDEVFFDADEDPDDEFEGVDESALNYKEIQDKTYTSLKSDAEKAYVNKSPKTVWKALSSCHNSAITGVCGHGHAYAKWVDCGKDFCPRCGKKDSIVHNRRKARLFKKARKMADMGYFVIEWELKDRKNLRTKKELSAAGTKITRLMKRLGYNRGYRAWHYFGDAGCPNGCHDNGQNNKDKPTQIDSMHLNCPICDSDFHINDAKVKWNPHLNILVDEGYIEKEKLEKIKKRIKDTLKVDGIVVNYQYVSAGDEQEIEKKVHWVNYITRATFISYAWDKEMSEELHKFRGLTSWGSRDEWAGEDKWELTEGNGDTETVIKLEDNKCLDCGRAIQWYPKVFGQKKLEYEWQTEELAGGYLRLKRLDRSSTMPKVSRFQDMQEGSISGQEWMEWKHGSYDEINGIVELGIEDKLWSQPSASEMDAIDRKKHNLEIHTGRWTHQFKPKNY